MLKTKDIMSCLPLLACILGKQYNITVEIGGTTAYTNGKTIHIPSPVSYTHLTLPTTPYV